MKKAMHEAQGIGLSANQIGLNLKVFVAEVPNSKGELKFYAVFNPKIDKTDNEKDSSEEGCLSIPGKYGIVPRYKKILITGFDKNGRNLKIKGWGLIAKVFQHEIDHLNGLLFIDRTKNVYEVPKTEHKH
jgi:peptide deformylase